MSRFGGRKFEPAGSLTELLPAIRGAVSSERAKVLTVDTSERVMEFVCSEQAERLVTGRRAVSGPPRAHQAPAAVGLARERDAGEDRRARRGSTAPTTARTSSRSRARATSPATPTPRVVLVEGMGLVSTGTTTKLSKISRDLYHRAIEVIAGAEALGEFVSLDAGESFAIEYWPLELYKLAQAPKPGELQGKVALVTGGAGGIGRAIIDTLASRRGVRGVVRPRCRRRRRSGGRPTATVGCPWPAT